MSTCKRQQIQVVDSTGKVRGHVVRHIRSSLWRATGKSPPMVNLGGKEYRPAIVGSGREAFLRVHLPPGAALPKDLQSEVST